MLDFCQEKQQTLSLMANEWQYIIVNTNGTPANKVINIFSNIAYNFRKFDKKLYCLRGKESNTYYQTNLTILSKEFNCSISTVNRSLARLEKMGYIKRHYKHIQANNGQWLYNVLFIELTASGYNLCAMIPNFFRGSSPQICRDIFKEKIKDIDLGRSNLTKDEKVEENFTNKDQIDLIKQPKKILTAQQQNIAAAVPEEQGSFNNAQSSTENETSPKKQIRQIKFRFREAKPFTDCLPITAEEADYLRTVTSRDFSTEFINNLVRELQIRKPELNCTVRSGLINYLIKSIRGEKRADDNIKDGKYKFKHIQEREQLFAEIEESGKTTIDAKVQQRILASFDQSTAWRILAGCRFPEKVLIADHTSKRSYRVYYQDSIQLDDREKEIIIKAVQDYSSYTDEQTGKILTAEVFFLKNSLSSLTKMNTVQAITSTKSTTTDIDIQVIQTQSSTDHVKSFELSTTELTKVDTIWQRVRVRLQKRYGLAVDKSWFSKIDFSYNESTQIVELQYDSIFRQRKADVDYGYNMYAAIRAELPSLKAVKSRANNSAHAEDVWWPMPYYEHQTSECYNFDKINN